MKAELHEDVNDGSKHTIPGIGGKVEMTGFKKVGDQTAHITITILIEQFMSTSVLLNFWDSY